MGSNKDKSQGKKGGKKTPEAPAAREGSKLLKRGEQNKDTKHIGKTVALLRSGN